MTAARNPLVERLTFFWHRHWACSLDSVDLLFMARQNDLFRRYADLGANPGADFRTLAYEVSEDPAMLRYLNGELNRRGRPNENYARELMELFCLGVTDAVRQPNYTEADVRELARALSGWTIDVTDPNNPRGLFTTSRFDTGSKTFLGRTGTFGSRQAVDIVLAHPQHAELHRRGSSGRSSSRGRPTRRRSPTSRPPTRQTGCVSSRCSRRSSRTRSCSTRSPSRP